MKIAVATLESLSPYSQSRYHALPKQEKEAPDAYEERTWRFKTHFEEKSGEIYIPPMQFKKAIEGAGKMLRMRIPGKGQSEYGKHIKAGVLVTEPLMLGITKDDVPGEWLHMNADGKSGSGTRVLRCFPCIREWGGEVTYYVLDDTITKEAFEVHLKESGNFVGLGRFRPACGGFYGRFAVKSVKWSNG